MDRKRLESLIKNVENVEKMDLSKGGNLNENSLKTFFLGVSKICSISENTFNGLTKLIDLNLDENELSNMNEKTFNGLTNTNTYKTKF